MMLAKKLRSWFASESGIKINDPSTIIALRYGVVSTSTSKCKPAGILTESPSIGAKSPPQVEA